MPGRSQTAESVEDVLELVRTRLTETIGAENLLGVSIDLDTSFDADLEMDSIEFVALMERLSEDYGEGLDVIEWLSGLEFEEIVELTVGDLVRFVVSSVS